MTRNSSEDRREHDSRPFSPAPAGEKVAEGRMRGALLIALLLFAGCSFFSRSQSRFYSIDRIPAAAPAAIAAGLPIGIDGVELPPGFDRREVVVRKPDHQLEVRSSEQWSASLGTLVLHTLAFDLAGRLPVGMVILPGEAKPASMRSIDVVFEEIAAGPDAKLNLVARWTVRTNGAGGIASREELTVDLPNLDSASIATATSQALATLADRIAARIAR